MAGERSERMIDLAARGAARMSRRLSMVNERFAPQSDFSDVRELTFQEVMAHFNEQGHMAPSEGCTHPTCAKAAAFIQQAITMAMAPPQQPGQAAV